MQNSHLKLSTIAENIQRFLSQLHILAIMPIGIMMLCAAILSITNPLLAFVLSVSSIIALFFVLKHELPYYLLIVLLHLTNIFFVIQGSIYVYSISELFSFLILLFWFFSRAAKFTTPYRRTPCDIPIIMFISLALLSLLWTNDYEKGIYQWIRLFSGICIFIVTISTINNYRMLNIVVWIIIVMGCINSILCFLSIHSYPDYTYAEFESSNYGLILVFNDTNVGKRGHAFSHPLTTACWLNFALILSFGKFIMLKGKKKIILAVLIFFMLTGHMTTLSKGPLLALICGIIFLFYSFKPIRKFFFTSIAVLILVIIVSFFLSNITQLKWSLKYTARQMSASESFTSTDSRKNWWKQSTSKSIENYGLGVGLGGISQYLRPYAPHPHSVFVSAFGELGFLGLGLLILIYSLAFKNYMIALKQCRNEYYRLILLSYIGGFVTLIFYIITDYEYSTNLLWWYLGFGFAISNLAKAAPSEHTDESLPAAIKGNSPI
ncbi:MAG: O-antigen ligase family protein [Planctomycetes bacterium]|nr:O-antigen ligase family protein [Planctomycetota bacterium]